MAESFILEIKKWLRFRKIKTKEPLDVWTWLTPHFNQNGHFPTETPKTAPSYYYRSFMVWWNENILGCDMIFFCSVAVLPPFIFSSVSTKWIDSHSYQSKSFLGYFWNFCPLILLDLHWLQKIAWASLWFSTEGARAFSGAPGAGPRTCIVWPLWRGIVWPLWRQISPEMLYGTHLI